MRKNLFSLAVLFHFIFLNSFAQVIKFQEAVGDTGSDYGSSIMQMANGQYIMTATTLSFGPAEVYLVRADASGSNIFAKHFGGTSNDGSTCVRQTADGGFITVGNSSSFGAGMGDVYIVKTDVNFILTWSKTIGGTAFDYGRSIRQLSDGSYIIAGVTESFGAGSSDVYLVKIDGNGNLLWTQTYGGTGADDSYSVEQTTDGGFIIAGYTVSFGAGAKDVYLIKTDASGIAQWTKTYGGTGDDEAHCVVQCSDGGYAITGSTYSFGAGNSDVYLIRTDGSGNVLWSETFGGTNVDAATYLQQTPDDGFIITGYTGSFGAGNWDAYLLKTNDLGVLTWSRVFGGTNVDLANCLDQTSDGGYAVVGITFSFSPIHADIYFIKTDSNGTCGCNEMSPPTVTTPAVSSTSSPTPAASSGGTVSTPATTWWYGGSIIMQCPAVGIDELQAQTQLTIYPNPSAGTFSISANKIPAHGDLNIFNIAGEKIYSTEISFPLHGDLQIQLNAPAGIYFITINSEEHLWRGKILIQ
jgi:hypothetical protein